MIYIKLFSSKITITSVSREFLIHTNLKKKRHELLSFGKVQVHWQISPWQFLVIVCRLSLCEIHVSHCLSQILLYILKLYSTLRTKS